SGTLAALMLSVGLVIGLAGMARASYGSIIQWMDSTLNPDFFVSPTGKLTERSYRFPPSIGDQLRALPGIAEVQSVRIARIIYRNRPIMLTAVKVESLQRRIKPPIVFGNAGDMYPR